MARKKNWFQSGKIESIIQYENGYMHGDHVAFFENGTKSKEWTTKKDVLHGKLTYWNPDGSVEYCSTYVNGESMSYDVSVSYDEID